MSWNSAELARLGDAEEVRVSSVRPDGSDRPGVTIWVVRVGDELYIRSAYGTENPWYRRATRAGQGRIAADGVDRAVGFLRIDPDDTATQDAVDAAYHQKYDRFGPQIVGTVTGPGSRLATLRVDPR